MHTPENITELRDIPGFEGLYAVTPSGQVWSYPKRHGAAVWPGFWMSPAQARGYLFVTLRKAGKSKMQHLQRLVALCWLNLPEEGQTQVNHIDGDKTNNRVDNLEWVTPSANIRHAFATGLASQRGSRNAGSKLTEAEVAAIRIEAARGIVLRRLAERYKVSPSIITNIVQRKAWAHVA